MLCLPTELIKGQIMKNIVLFLILFMGQAYASVGVTTYKSSKNFFETTSAVENFIKKKGLTLFSIVDHAKNAKEAKLTLPPTTLFIFGNPQVGTPLMQQNREMALDLPVKILVYEEKGSVYVSYNDPTALSIKHEIKADHLSFTKMSAALGAIRMMLE